MKQQDVITITPKQLSQSTIRSLLKACPREKLREIARGNSCSVGRDKHDTIQYIINNNLPISVVMKAEVLPLFPTKPKHKKMPETNQYKEEPKSMPEKSNCQDQTIQQQLVQLMKQCDQEQVNFHDALLNARYAYENEVMEKLQEENQ